MNIIQPIFVLCVCFGCLLAEICPRDWHRYGESCYFIITDMMDWYEANRTCAESRAIIAIPNSQSEENDIYRELFQKNLDQTQGAELWICCNDIEEERKWQDCPLKDETNGYENWGIGQPSDRYKMYNCGQIWRDQWDDTDCYDPKYAICERHVSTPVSTTLPGINGRLTPQCLLHHAMKELMGNGVVSCGKSCRSHPRCHSFNLIEQDCPPVTSTHNNISIEGRNPLFENQNQTLRVARTSSSLSSFSESIMGDVEPPNHCVLMQIATASMPPGTAQVL
ncbi:L-selectin-like [Asterias amurensis]|uniref:L-selectin-like n=1 Tax=Asterias amurensis TaxID=7602 RepID=UPI003AB17A8C